MTEPKKSSLSLRLGLATLLMLFTGVCLYFAWQANQRQIELAERQAAYCTPVDPIVYDPSISAYQFTNGDFADILDRRAPSVQVDERVTRIRAYLDRLRVDNPAEAEEASRQLESILQNRNGPYEFLSADEPVVCVVGI